MSVKELFLSKIQFSATQYLRNKNTDTFQMLFLGFTILQNNCLRESSLSIKDSPCHQVKQID